jgi:Tfp pilus assembly protein PilF
VFRELATWLGMARLRLIAGLVLVAVAVSLVLQGAFAGKSWLITAQIAVVWVSVVGIVLVLDSRLSGEGRRRLWLVQGPGLALLGLGIVVPALALVFGGAGLGWIVAAQFVLRGQVRMEYQNAIRHLRQGEYDEAAAIMERLITAEPDESSHYRFRAELYRLAGTPALAMADYKRVIELSSESAQGYAGLAEVHAQQGDFEAAHRYGLVALEREPRQWLNAYNMGLIADRLGDAAHAVAYLEQVLSLGVPHSRYRLLTRLWLARNHYRQGQLDAARQQVELMRKQAPGLRDWQLILASEHAAPLRGLLEPDIELARRLLEGASLDVLASVSSD